MGERRLTAKPTGTIKKSEMMDEIIERGSPEAGESQVARKKIKRQRKVNVLVGMPADVLEQLDEHLDDLGIKNGRSQWISEAVEQRLNMDT